MRRLRTLLALALVGGFALVTVPAAPAGADTLGIDFEAFADGSPDGQDGWNADGSNGAGCATYDHEIVTNAGAPASFGTKSLRMSNAVTSGCFGDQTFSKSLTDEAGEIGAANGGMSGGVRQAHFEAEWQFASTVPGAEQPGLSVVASPDRGDGARISWIQMADSPTGLVVNFSDYRDEHVVGTSGNLANGCTGSDNFYSTTIASGLDRTQEHTIKATIDFLQGPRNDVARVWVDGTLVHTDTSWEDYFRYCEATNTSRTVDSLLFRTGGTAAPGTSGNGFLIDNIELTSGPIVTDDSEGEWTLFPAQSVTSTTSTTTDTLYRAKVRPPINADGSSNFPKRRGVIPVQFDLESSTHTVTSTTTVTGPAKFESILSDDDTSNDFSFLRFVPDTPMRFADLNELTAYYAYTEGNCGLGSLRWSVRLDVGNDNATVNDKSINIYFGDVPNFTDCDGPESNSGQNLIGSSDARFDLQGVGGPFYGTYADALAMIGGTNVLRSSLVLDSGSATDQRVTLTKAVADGSEWTPLPTGTNTVIDSESTTPYAKTCALPEARLKWSKVDNSPSGAVNEADSVQPQDSDGIYRIVDCKYIYNLDVSSLGALATRDGTYWVWVNIGGTNWPTPAKFDLR